MNGAVRKLCNGDVLTCGLGPRGRYKQPGNGSVCLPLQGGGCLHTVHQGPHSRETTGGPKTSNVSVQCSSFPHIFQVPSNLLVSFQCSNFPPKFRFPSRVPIAIFQFHSKVPVSFQCSNCSFPVSFKCSNAPIFIFQAASAVTTACARIPEKPPGLQQTGPTVIIAAATAAIHGDPDHFLTSAISR